MLSKLWKLLNKEIYPWPYIDLWLDVGFLQIKTDLMCYRFETMTYQYITLGIKLFWKWGFSFRLYRPERS